MVAGKTASRALPVGVHQVLAIMWTGMYADGGKFRAENYHGMRHFIALSKPDYSNALDMFWSVVTAAAGGNPPQGDLRTGFGFSANSR